jgi:hypothetical protein
MLTAFVLAATASGGLAVLSAPLPFRALVACRYPPPSERPRVSVARAGAPPIACVRPGITGPAPNPNAAAGISAAQRPGDRVPRGHTGRTA